MGQVLRYKTHQHGSDSETTPFTKPRAQSAALHGKTRPYHVHARAMVEERVDPESGADKIVARKSFNEEGSVEDIVGNCPPYEPPSAGVAKDEAEEPQISHSDTEPSADKDSMCDREDNRDALAEQEPEEIGEETVLRYVPQGIAKSQGKTMTFSYLGPILPSDDSKDESSTQRRPHQSHQGKLQVSPRYPTILARVPPYA
jgi:hypothetical protein